MDIKEVGRVDWHPPKNPAFTFSDELIKLCWHCCDINKLHIGGRCAYTFTKFKPYSITTVAIDEARNVITGVYYAVVTIQGSQGGVSQPYAIKDYYFNALIDFNRWMSK